MGDDPSSSRHRASEAGLQKTATTGYVYPDLARQIVQPPSWLVGSIAAIVPMGSNLPTPGSYLESSVFTGFYPPSSPLYYSETPSSSGLWLSNLASESSASGTYDEYVRNYDRISGQFLNEYLKCYSGQRNSVYRRRQADAEAKQIEKDLRKKRRLEKIAKDHPPQELSRHVFNNTNVVRESSSTSYREIPFHVPVTASIVPAQPRKQKNTSAPSFPTIRRVAV